MNFLMNENVIKMKNINLTQKITLILSILRVMNFRQNQDQSRFQ